VGTARIQQMFGDETDSAASPAAVTASASSGTAPTNGSVLKYRTRALDASVDNDFHFHFLLPSNYASGGTLVVQWLSVATSGIVIFKTAYLLVHPSTEASPTDLDAASFGTVTSQAGVSPPLVSGQIKQTSIDLGVTGAHAGDGLIVLFGRDADNAGDTCASPALLREPWQLVVNTV